MSKFFVLTLLLLSAFNASAQGISRGGGLKKRQFQTYSTATYYLDPAGSDANSCTAAGAASACATLNGVWDKLPRTIRHDITINVAAGSYTFDSRWNNAIWGESATTPSLSEIGANVLIEGPALTNFTPATGTATGTSTGTTTTVAPLPTVTDSTQTWTVNDLRGRFLVMTSGSLSGQARVIVANTATTITHSPWNSGGPAPGDTYAIQTPAATFSGLQSFQNHTGINGILRFSRIELSDTGAVLYVNQTDASFTPQLSLVRAITTSGSSTTISVTRCRFPVGATSGGVTNAPYYVENMGTGTAISATEVGATGSSLSGHLYAYSSSTSATGTVYISSGPRISAGWLNIIAETNAAAGTALRIQGMAGTASGISNSTVSVRCPAGSTGTGAALWGNTATVLRFFEAVNCGTGMKVGLASSAGAFNDGYLQVQADLVCTSTTTCMNTAGGARSAVMVAPTFTGVTNEYTVDGTSYTHSFINGLAPKRVTGNAGSILELE